MGKYFQKILFIIISFSFFISATEIDLGESHNTFFDEYDTYLKAEHDTFEYTVTAKEVQASSLSLHNLFTSHILLSNTQPSKSSPTYSEQLQSQKLFLRNSVWRI